MASKWGSEALDEATHEAWTELAIRRKPTEIWLINGNTVWIGPSLIGEYVGVHNNQTSLEDFRADVLRAAGRK